MKNEKQFVNVSFDEMLTKLMTVEKGTFNGLKLVTEPRMLTGGRKNPITGEYPNKFVNRVKKVTTGVFMCGNSYGDRVRNKLISNGLDPNTYVPEPSKVGEHVSKCVLFNENTGEHYFQFELHKNNPNNHVKVDFLVDGMSLDQFIQNGFQPDFEQYLVKSVPSQKQIGLGIQDDETVIFFSPKVKNIKEFTVGGICYVQE